MKRILILLDIIAILAIIFGCNGCKPEYTKEEDEKSIETIETKNYKYSSVHLWNTHSQIEYWTGVDSISSDTLGTNFFYRDGKILGGWKDNQNVIVTFVYNNK